MNTHNDIVLQLPRAICNPAAFVSLGDVLTLYGRSLHIRAACNLDAVWVAALSRAVNFHRSMRDIPVKTAVISASCSQINQR